MRALAAALCLAACGAAEDGATTPVFHETGYPETLGDWGVLAADAGFLRLAERTTPYDIATPLFSDYAQKLRTLSLPEGTTARFDAAGDLDLPVGTIVTKTFYYRTAGAGAVRADPPPSFAYGRLALDGVRLIETRVLARRADGWIAIPYVWNEAQTEAHLARTGAILPLTLVDADGTPRDFSYVAPNQNQCAGCHATDNTTRAIRPIGLKARHLDKASAFAAGKDQLEAWRERGVLAADAAPPAGHAPNADWTDPAAPIDARARAYLDANCSHCHNPAGPADTSGLDLTPAASGPALGLCKAPIAAGRGSGGRPYGVVPGEPDQSILLFRMESVDPAEMMPELGRALAHAEGAALIRDWIATLHGSCD